MSWINGKYIYGFDDPAYPDVEQNTLGDWINLPENVSVNVTPQSLTGSYSPGPRASAQAGINWGGRPFGFLEGSYNTDPGSSLLGTFDATVGGRKYSGKQGQLYGDVNFQPDVVPGLSLGFGTGGPTIDYQNVIKTPIGNLDVMANQDKVMLGLSGTWPGLMGGLKDVGNFFLSPAGGSDLPVDDRDEYGNLSWGISPQYGRLGPTIQDYTSAVGGGLTPASKPAPDQAPIPSVTTSDYGFSDPAKTIAEATERADRIAETEGAFRTASLTPYGGSPADVARGKYDGGWKDSIDRLVSQGYISAPHDFVPASNVPKGSMRPGHWSDRSAEDQSKQYGYQSALKGAALAQKYGNLIGYDALKAGVAAGQYLQEGMRGLLDSVRGGTSTATDAMIEAQIAGMLQGIEGYRKGETQRDQEKVSVPKSLFQVGDESLVTTEYNPEDYTASTYFDRDPVSRVTTPDIQRSLQEKGAMESMLANVQAANLGSYEQAAIDAIQAQAIADPYGDAAKFSGAIIGQQQDLRAEDQRVAQQQAYDAQVAQAAAQAAAAKKAVVRPAVHPMGELESDMRQRSADREQAQKIAQSLVTEAEKKFTQATPKKKTAKKTTKITQPKSTTRPARKPNLVWVGGLNGGIVDLNNPGMGAVAGPDRWGGGIGALGAGSGMGPGAGSGDHPGLR